MDPGSIHPRCIFRVFSVAEERFGKAIELTGFKKEKQFVNNGSSYTSNPRKFNSSLGLGHLLVAHNASAYMLEVSRSTGIPPPSLAYSLWQGKFESAAVHLRSLRRMMLMDEAKALNEVLHKPPVGQRHST